MNQYLERLLSETNRFDFSQQGILLNEWGKANSPADLNLSGRVEGMDLAFLLWGWQQPIPQR